jgi:hypothetical protein
MTPFYALEHLEFIHRCREEGLTWQETADSFNAKFKTKKTHDTLRISYEYHKAGTTEELDVGVLKQTRTVRKSNARLRREANIALDALNQRQDILDSIEQAIKKLSNIKAPQTAKPKVSKTKRNSTLELMFSDIHYGKKTEEVGLVDIRRRVREVADALIFKIGVESKMYNITEVLIACLGDVIESASMHGEESVRGCEFGNAKQVAVAIESIFEDLLYPLAATGYPLTFLGIPGNHDRAGPKRTYHNPGEERLTYTIYKTLELLCKAAKIKNIKFIIPKESYKVYKIYGSNYLYEHGYNVKPSLESCEKLINSRQTQYGEIIAGLRLGHWHQLMMFGRGRVIINESVIGPDSFSKELGFTSKAGQTIVQYIETERRDSPFYQIFPVYLS